MIKDRQSRRRFLLRVARTGLFTTGALLLAGCAASPGQSQGGLAPGRVARIGFLSGSIAAEVPAIDDLRQGLRELGWVDGQNIIIEVRTGEGDELAMPAAAAELVRIPGDLIVTQGPAAPRAARTATSDLPIVMSAGPADPVGEGLAASIQRPGSNVTGVLASRGDIYGKRLELLVDAVPGVARVAIIAAGPGTRAVEDTARILGVQVQRLRVLSEQDLEGAFEVVGRATADAVLVWSNAVTNSNRAPIVDFIARQGLPSMFETPVWPARGGLMSYGHDVHDMARRAASYVDRILQGANPGDLPIEYPTRYDFVINLKAAAALGITIPEPVLAQATEVIR